MLNFTSLLVHSFVVYPVAYFLLLRPVPSVPPEKLASYRNMRLVQVSLFFLLCSFVDVYVNHPAIFDANMFQVLQVPRSASVQDIKRAFRKLSLSEHPDKNPEKDPSGFTTLQHAHDVLTNEVARAAYDAWGPVGVKWVEKNENVLLAGGISMAMDILGEFALTLFLTLMAGANATGRSMSYSMLAVFVFLVGSFRFVPEQDFFGGLLDYRFARFQLVQLLWAMYPPLVMALCAVSKVIFPDRDQQLLELAQFVALNQVEILRRLGGDPQRAAQGGTFAGTPPPPAPQPGFFARIPSWVYLIVFSVVFNWVTGENKR